MTEGQQDALPVVEQEVAGKPTPQVSGGSAEAGSAAAGPDAVTLDKRLAQIEEKLSVLDRLDDVVDARVKSTKDKRFVDLQRLKDALDEAKGDVKLAARNMLLDEMLDGRQSQGSTQVQGIPSGKGGSEDAEKKIAEAKTTDFLNKLKDRSGIEFTDDELKAIWSGKRYARVEDGFEDVERAAWKKAKQANVGAGAAASASGSQGAQSESDDEILAKYEAAARNPAKNSAEIKRLTEEAKKRGLLK